MKPLLVIVITLVLFGCQEVIRPERPENLIPKEKMVQILAESYTGNAARSVRNRTLRDAGITLDSILYAEYDIDSITFAESNAYYASQLNDYIQIMTEVEAILSAKKKRLDSVLELEAQKQRDSLDKNRKGRKKQKDTSGTGLIEPAKE